MDTSKSKAPEYCETTLGKWVKVVRDMIRDLEFGEVQLSIHRGRVTEVRKLEKFRFVEAAKAEESGHEVPKGPDAKCHR
jgi:hypothetical protein